MKSTNQEDHGEQQAKAQFESIVDYVAALKAAREADNDDEREEAEQAIHEDPLSVEVRSGWYAPGAKPEAPEEFCILLCTGGPAVRIIGTLSEYCEPESARIEHQDWGTPWTEYRLTGEQQETLLKYCRCFYFGE